MVNQFNQKSVTEGKTSVVEAGDPDGTLFLVNPEVGALPPCVLHVNTAVPGRGAAAAFLQQQRGFLHLDYFLGLWAC